MADDNDTRDYSDVEVRRERSGRQMSLFRRIVYAIGEPLLRAVVYLLNASYRVEKVIGSELADRIVSGNEAYIPCYWHGHTLVCVNLVRSWLRRGFKGCFVISASVDGEVPTKIAESWGAYVIRGSASKTGTLVMRDAHRVMKQGISIISAPDGPRGPCHEFKAGVVLMSRIGGAPMVPIAFAANRAWTLNTWDRFVLPMPFARIVISIGEPVEVPRGASMADIEAIRLKMKAAIDAQIQVSRAAVVDAT